MPHECPNCREPITYWTAFRTPVWRTFRCTACGSVLGVSLARRIIAVLAWLAVLFFVGEFLGLQSWGRVYAYTFMIVSMLAIIGAGDRVVLVERRAFTCRQCGYDLHGLADPRCPECGAEFDPAERARIQARRFAPPPGPRHVWMSVPLVACLTLAVAGGLVAWQRATRPAPGAWWLPALIAMLALAAIVGLLRSLHRPASPVPPTTTATDAPARDSHSAGDPPAPRNAADGNSH